MAHQLIRTGTLDWIADPDIPGFKQQVLHRDAARKSVVRKWFVPPGWGDVLKGKPDRHYHKTVIERAYTLAGDFPHWEFSAVDDFDGELVVFRRHTVMDRPPGSLHGMQPSPRSQAGAQILYWNTGAGTSIAEKDFAKETVNVAFDKSARVARDTFPACRLFQADDVPWQRHPSISGLKIKHLMPALTDAADCTLVMVPADWMPMAAVTFAVAGDFVPWLYIISGDVRLRMSGDGRATEALLGDDDYMEWDGGTTVAFGQGEASMAGCIMLCNGLALA